MEERDIELVYKVMTLSKIRKEQGRLSINCSKNYNCFLELENIFKTPEFIKRHEIEMESHNKKIKIEENNG